MLKNKKEPIAIIGIGCRFPGEINNVDKYWASLKNKVNAITEIPYDRWDKDVLFDKDYTKTGKIHIKKGGFIRDIDKFDAHFFNISPNEAIHMDPQQRLLLEVSYETLEDSGIKHDVLSGSNTCVFIGICGHDYGEITTQVKERATITSNTNTGISHSIAANRISYFFNLKGPSISIDTACSSSLTAIHLACKSIWSEESTMAFAGGVNIIIRPEATMGFSKGNYLSPDCICRSFDDGANGYVRSEGVGMILMKPLSQAIKDKNKIYSLIVGSAINQDGRTPGMTVPDAESQKNMIINAYKDAGINPNDICYVEAHGTGTPIGDPVEAEAIGSTIGLNREKNNICYIGSVKTNIGHLETASGVAGIIKLALILKNKEIVPNLHFKNPNFKIKFDEYNLRVPTENIIIENTEHPLYGGINSFGFGGSNAHVALQEPKNINASKETNIKLSEKIPNIFVITAKNNESLKKLALKYNDYLQNDMNLDDLCYSSYEKRSFYDYRFVSIINNKVDLLSSLNSFLKSETKTGMIYNKQLYDRKIVFVYSGQGPQWWAMGRQLINSVPLFSEEIKKIDKTLFEIGWMKNENVSLYKELLKDEQNSRINEANIAQPAIFAIQVALTKLWNTMGIYPDAILGHSLGEITASYICGALTLTESLKLLIARMFFQVKSEGKGGMLAVGLTENEAKKEIDKYNGLINIAVYNGPKSITLSGEINSINQLSNSLTERNIFNRIVKLNIPYHSFMMDEYKEDFLNTLGDIKPDKENIPIFSTVTSLKIEGNKFDKEHWYKNIRQPVLFYQAVKNMINEGYNVFLEISPHPILSESIRETFEEVDKKGVIISSLKRKEDEIFSIFNSLGNLFSYGFNFNWNNIWDKNYNYISLPFYEWNKERYWCESEKSKIERIGEKRHPHLGEFKKFVSNDEKIIWNIELDSRFQPYINDHKVQGTVVYPAAGQIDIVSSIAKVLFKEKFYYIENINFVSPIFLTENNATTLVQFEIISEDGNFYIHSKQKNEDSNWILNSFGRINFIDNNFVSENINFVENKKNIKESISVKNFYEGCLKGGLHLGPTFMGIKNLWNQDQESIGEIEVNRDIENDINKFTIHPAVLDACLQSSLGILNNKKNFSGVFIPVNCQRIKFHKNHSSKRLWTYSRISKFSEKNISVNIWIFDENKEIICEIQELSVKYLEGSNTNEDRKIESFFYETNWKFKKRIEDEKHRDPLEYLVPIKEVKDYLFKIEHDVINRKENDEYCNKFTPELDNLCISYIIQSLKDLGLNYRVNNIINSDEFIKNLNISDRFHRLLKHFFYVLEKYEYLKRHQKDYKIINDTNIINSNEELLRLKNKYQQFPHELILLNRCAPNLKKVFLEEQNSIELLFPEKDWDSVIQFYNEAYSFKESNEVILKAIKKIIENLPDDQTIRIIEIGAGTGGMSNGVLSILPQDRTDYYFTDLSNIFLIKAKERFKKYNFVNYKILDIEKDIENQDFELNTFDIVIASDVIHATRDIKKSLNNIKKLLASNGLLIMLEVTKVPLYVDLVFGLTDGWWLFNDLELRKNHSALSENKWLGILKDLKFSETISLMHNIKEDSYPQTIFIAQSPIINNSEKIINKKKNKWLVFNDKFGIGDKLCDEFIKNNDTVYKVEIDNDNKNINEFITSININDLNSIGQFLEKIDLGKKQFTGLIYLWAINKSEDKEITDNLLKENQKKQIIPLLEIANKIENYNLSKKPIFWIISNGSFVIEKKDKKINIENSAIWGFSRVIANEYPSIPVSIVDLSYNPGTAELINFVRELNSGNIDLEVALRDKKRFINFLQKIEEEKFLYNSMKTVSSSNYPYNLKSVTPGILDSLSLIDNKKENLQNNDVEIDVYAIGLNYRDIMLAMNILPEDSIINGFFEDKYGLECSGRIVRIGDKVKDFKIGDEVIAIAKNSISGLSVTKNNLVVLKPKNIDFKEAATIPISYITAYYILKYLCNINGNEKILIHSGAGGLGLCLINLAKLYNAEIFTTVSTDEKREYLSSIGIKNIYNSRTSDFKNEILKQTNGKGVDIVINTLSGNLINSSLKCLASFGRFIELGKIDINKNKQIDIRNFANNISYFSVDLDKICKEKPDIISNLFKDVIKLVENNILPPIKYSLYNISEVKNAFINMSKSKHLGKIIIETNEKSKEISIFPSNKLELKYDSSYLIIGGCSGFGLTIADWITTKGAKNIILVSRNGVKNIEDEKIVNQIKNRGINVKIFKADITKFNEVEQLFININKQMPKIKGIIHSAMVLDDIPLSKLNYDRYMKVFEPKAIGAWNLHLLSLKENLDFFIMFSSVSSVMGNPGQANYSAGNSFLDSLSYYRRINGLPSNTINWGAIGETGFFIRSEKVGNKLLNQGFKSFSIKQSTEIFEKVIIQNPIQSVVMDINWDKFKTFFPEIIASNKFSYLNIESNNLNKSSNNISTLKDLIINSIDQEKTNLLKIKLSDFIARILGTSSLKLDFDESLMSLGFDSLMANQLRSWISTNLNIDYHLMNIMKGPSINDLTEELLNEINSLSINKNNNLIEKELFYPEIKRIEAKGQYFLSSGQKRLFTLDQLENIDITYNMTYVLNTKDNINFKEIENAINLLVQRHEMLRTSFELRNNEPIQITYDNYTFKVDQIKSDLNSADDIISEYIKPFLLNNLPLFRVGIFKLKEETFFVFDMHHIITDGMSMGILVNELVDILQNKNLDALNYNYFDFIFWQKKVLESDIMHKQKKYWINIFKDKIKILNIPTDYERSMQKTYFGNCIYKEIPEKTYDKINDFILKKGVTLYTFLFAIFNILLSKHSGSDDIIIGTPTLGRQLPEFHKIIGLFVNTLAIRTNIDIDYTFENFLEILKLDIIESFENQDYQFEQIIADLNIQRIPGRNPLFDVMFVLQNNSNNTIIINENLTLYPYRYDNKTTKFDLLLETVKKDKNLIFRFEYNSSLFKEKTIENFLADYIKLMETVIDNDKVEMKDLLFTNYKQIKNSLSDDIQFNF